MSRTIFLHPASAPGTSVIVPIAERPAALDDLYREFREAVARDGGRFEFIFVVESWRRAVTDILAPLVDSGEPIHVVEVSQTASEATLIEAGASHAQYPVVAVLPPYPRITADGLSLLMERLTTDRDLVTARRYPRRDHWWNRVQAFLLHSLLRHTVWVRFFDIGSGVRVMNREVLEEIPLYAEFARFLPILAVRAGFRVEEVSVPQHPGDLDLRLRGPGTYLRRGVDLVGLAFLVRFTRKPLRFFGSIGATLVLLGGVILAVLAAQRVAGQPLADRPLLLLGVLVLVLGAQSIGLGLIGELIVHFRASETRGYRLADEGSRPREAGAGAGSAPREDRDPVSAGERARHARS